MSNTTAKPLNEIKKLHIKEAATFAIKYIPEVDKPTIEKFVELLKTSGTFRSITDEEFFEKMRLTLKYVPGASIDSLMILVELLGIQPHNLSRALRALPQGPALPVAGQVKIQSVYEKS